jgi:hypothetical protein
MASKKVFVSNGPRYAIHLTPLTPEGIIAPVENFAGAKLFCLFMHRQVEVRR